MIKERGGNCSSPTVVSMGFVGSRSIIVCGMRVRRYGGYHTIRIAVRSDVIIRTSEPDYRLRIVIWIRGPVGNTNGCRIAVPESSPSQLRMHLKQAVVLRLRLPPETSGHTCCSSGPA